MPRYLVTLYTQAYETYEIEAPNEDTAIEDVYQGRIAGPVEEWQNDSWELDGIEEVEE